MVDHETTTAILSKIMSVHLIFLHAAGETECYNGGGGGVCASVCVFECMCVTVYLGVCVLAPAMVLLDGGPKVSTVEPISA